jgi:hypothetical protein
MSGGAQSPVPMVADRMGLTYFLFLTVWELWNERNARVFRNIASTPAVVILIIRGSASLWGISGANYLSALMPREYIICWEHSSLYFELSNFFLINEIGKAFALYFF